jgi:hypothetical protein
MFLVGRGLSLVPGHCDGFHGKLSSFSISDDSPSITKAQKPAFPKIRKKKIDQTKKTESLVLPSPNFAIRQSIVVIIPKTFPNGESVSRPSSLHFHFFS